MVEVKTHPHHPSSMAARIQKRTQSSSPDHGRRVEDHNRSDASATTAHETRTSIFHNGGGTFAKGGAMSASDNQSSNTLKGR